ncbi:MAG: DHH family phosphoesterase, partial [Flavobacteriales bacterium]
MLLEAVAKGAAAQLAGLLSVKRRAAIITHYNPDGDAIGSGLGLMHLLRAAGHQATVLLPNAAPEFLHWMPGYGQAIPFDRRRDDCLHELRAAEVVFCLDFNRRDRAGGLEQPLRDAPVPTVLIDHHQDPEPFASIAFSDPAACATSELVCGIAFALGWRDLMGVDAATCLYAGLVTDSGSFRFSSTTPGTLRLAADLMALGVPFTEVHERIMDDNRPQRLRLLGFTLSERMEVLPEL